MLVKLALVTFGMCTVMGHAFAQGSSTSRVVLDFDDLRGQRPLKGQHSGFLEGTPVRPDALVDTRYLPQGVVFDAPGGGIFVALSPRDSFSGPNAAGSTSPGPLISRSNTITATFWLEDTPATPDYISIRLSGPSTVSFYNARGRRFATGSGGDTIILNGTGAFSVHIDLGPTAFFDDFTIGELRPIRGLALSPLLPGKAGTTNVLHVSGGSPGDTVLVEIGLDAGSPDTRLPSNARILRVVRLDGDGRATVSLDVPSDCAGMRLSARGLSSSGESTQTVEDYLAPAPWVAPAGADGGVLTGERPL